MGGVPLFACAGGIRRPAAGVPDGRTVTRETAVARAGVRRRGCAADGCAADGCAADGYAGNGCFLHRGSQVKKGALGAPSVRKVPQAGSCILKW